MLADPCVGPGIFARDVQARLPENSSDNVFFLFCPQLLLFYSGLLMIYFKENYNFTLQGFVGGGGGGRGLPNIFQEGPTFSMGGGGVKLFPGDGGRGSKC